MTEPVRLRLLRIAPFATVLCQFLAIETSLFIQSPTKFCRVEAVVCARSSEEILERRNPCADFGELNADGFLPLLS